MVQQFCFGKCAKSWIRKRALKLWVKKDGHWPQYNISKNWDLPPEVTSQSRDLYKDVDWGQWHRQEVTSHENKHGGYAQWNRSL